MALEPAHRSRGNQISESQGQSSTKKVPEQSGLHGETGDEGWMYHKFKVILGYIENWNQPRLCTDLC